MAFAFEITAVHTFPRAGVGILEGKILKGAVTTGSILQLIHRNQIVPFRVKGIVLDATGIEDDMSLTVDLREKALKCASAGDRVVSISTVLPAWT